MEKRKVNFLAFLRDIANTAAFAAACSVFFMYLREVFSQTAHGSFPGVVFIFATAFADYAARLLSGNLVSFLFIHLAMIPAALLLHLPAADTVILGTYLALLFYLALRFWTGENTSKTMCCEQMPSEILIVILPLYIHSVSFLSGGLSDLILYFSIIYLALYYIGIYLEKMLTYLLSLPSGSTLPLKRIVVTNLSIIGLILLAAVLLIRIASSFADGDNSLLLFIGYLLKGFVKIFSGCMSCFKDDVYDSSIEETTSAERETYPNLTDDMTKDMHGNEIIMAVSNALKVIFLIVLAAFLLYLLYQFFKTYMHKGKRENDIVEKISPTISETDKKTQKRFSLFRVRNNNERVRRIYRKKILTYHGSDITVNPSDTPVRICEKIRQKTADDISKLTEFYEKARYGNEMLSDEEITKIKRLSRKS